MHKKHFCVLKTKSGTHVQGITWGHILAPGDITFVTFQSRFQGIHMLTWIYHLLCDLCGLPSATFHTTLVPSAIGTIFASKTFSTDMIKPCIFVLVKGYLLLEIFMFYVTFENLVLLINTNKLNEKLIQVRWIDSIFYLVVIIGNTCQYVPKTCSLVRKAPSIAKGCSGVIWSTVVSAALATGGSLVFILQAHGWACS